MAASIVPGGPAGQLGGEFIPRGSQAAPPFLLVRLRHQGLNLLAQALDFLLHIAITHRFVPRRIPLDFRPIGRHVAQPHQPSLTRQTHHLHKHIFEGLQMLLTESADRPKVRALLAHNGDEGQIPFTGPRNFSARKHPDTVRIEQQTDHHRRIKRRGPPRFLLIRGIEAA
jgi:hypothetical protein